MFVSRLTHYATRSCSPLPFLKIGGAGVLASHRTPLRFQMIDFVPSCLWSAVACHRLLLSTTTFALTHNLILNPLALRLFVAHLKRGGPSPGLTRHGRPGFVSIRVDSWLTRFPLSAFRFLFFESSMVSISAFRFHPAADCRPLTESCLFFQIPDL